MSTAENCEDAAMSARTQKRPPLQGNNRQPIADTARTPV